jgi:D-glycero-D-manno-heptose 1,7-bisphosphate phosphatase
MSGLSSPLVHRPERSRHFTAGRPRSAAFLDRDGTLVRDTHYLTDVRDLELLSGAADAVRVLSEERWIIVVTNQSAVARGMLSEAGLSTLHAALFEHLSAQRAPLDAIYTCPHLDEGPDGCSCRKPKPGLLLQAAADFELALDECVLFGDSGRDLQAADAAGVQGFAVTKNEPGGLLEAIRCLS